MSEAEDVATGERVWAEGHAALEIVLDEVTARSPAWTQRYAELAAIVVPVRRPPSKRWTTSRTGFARDAHHLIDMGLRQDPEILTGNMQHLRAMLQSKFTCQDELGGYVDKLATCVRELAAKNKGQLDPDTSDPLATLRDALLEFDPRLAKAMLRELLREDKYVYQRVRTDDHPLLLELARYLDAPRYAMWQLDNPSAISGRVAAGHPDRDTWWRDE